MSGKCERCFHFLLCSLLCQAQSGGNSCLCVPSLFYSQKASLWEHASSLEDTVNSTWQDTKGVSVPLGEGGECGGGAGSGEEGWRVGRNGGASNYGDPSF